MTTKLTDTYLAPFEKNQVQQNSVIRQLLENAQNNQTNNPQVVTSATSFFVEASGSDSNDGLSTGTAWATLQHAITTILQSWDLNGRNPNLNVGTGTFAGAAFAGPTRSGGSQNGGFLNIVGAGTTATNVSVETVFSVGNFVSNFAQYQVGNLNMTSTANQFSSIFGQFYSNPGFGSKVRITGPATSGTSALNSVIHVESMSYCELALPTLADLYGLVGTFADVGGNAAMLVDNGIINIFGALQSPMFLEGNAFFSTSNSPAFFVVQAGGATTPTGSYSYGVKDMSMAFISPAGTPWVPNLWGFVGQIGQLSATGGGGASIAPVVTGVTGVGTGIGTVSGDTKNGTITIHAATSSTAAGSVAVQFQETVTDINDNLSPYIGLLADNSGQWQNNATLRISNDTGLTTSGRAITFTWKNATTALTSGVTYNINYVCNS